MSEAGGERKNEMNEAILGMDIGGTNIRMGLITEEGKLFNEYRTSSDRIFGENAGKKLLEILRNYYADAVKSFSTEASNKTDLNKIKALCIGFPSTLNRERTIVLNSPNVPGLNNFPFARIYTEALGIPVWGEKDSCALIYYDMKMNHIPIDGLSIGIYVGTGLGNIILLNGEPLAGKNGAAGELGHIPLSDREDPCGCGLTGCLELYAGGQALERIRQKYYPNDPISSLFKMHSGEKPLEKYIETLAKALVIEITLLDPDHICLGGGVLNMSDFPKEQLIERIRKYVRYPYPRNSMDICVSSQDTPYNGVIGAGLYGWHMYRMAEQQIRR